MVEGQKHSAVFQLLFFSGFLISLKASSTCTRQATGLPSGPTIGFIFHFVTISMAFSSRPGARLLTKIGLVADLLASRLPQALLPLKFWPREPLAYIRVAGNKRTWESRHRSGPHATLVAEECGLQQRAEQEGRRTTIRLGQCKTATLRSRVIARISLLATVTRRTGHSFQ